MAALTLNTSVMDVNGETVLLTGDSTKLIKYHSIAEARMNNTAQGALSLDFSYLTYRGERYYGTRGDIPIWGNQFPIIFTLTDKPVENNVFTFFATDEYDNTGTATVTVEMIDYVRLTCNIGNNKPDANGDMTLTCSGNYFNGSFGYQSNNLSVKYSYTGSDGSSGSGNMTVYKSGNSYTASANLSGLNYQTVYSFSVTAKDKLEEVTRKKGAVTALPMFHWGENSVGEQDFTFEVPVYFNGSGVKFKDSYIKVSPYNMLIGAMDKLALYSPHEVELNADSISLNADSISLNNSTVISNTWTPKLNIQGPRISCTERYGWYQKLGSVVTVGWRLKATIPSGYDDTELNISGVPFTPSPFAYDEYGDIDYDAGLAFGGGVAFGIYTTEDYIFEGWSINANSIIKARLQRCEKFSSGNLQISSHSYYPKGGGVVTLGGTICFMTND